MDRFLSLRASKKCQGERQVGVVHTNLRTVSANMTRRPAHGRSATVLAYRPWTRSEGCSQSGQVAQGRREAIWSTTSVVVVRIDEMMMSSGKENKREAVSTTSIDGALLATWLCHNSSMGVYQRMRSLSKQAASLFSRMSPFGLSKTLNLHKIFPGKFWARLIHFVLLQIIIIIMYVKHAIQVLAVWLGSGYPEVRRSLFNIRSAGVRTWNRPRKKILSN
jgi:hypothetical protein